MDRILDVRRSSEAAYRPLVGDDLDMNPHILSSVPRSVIDIARHLKRRELFTTPRIHLSSISLVDPMLGFAIAKSTAHARLFADLEMISHSGGCWFIKELHRRLSNDIVDMRALACEPDISDVESSTRSTYYFFNIMLVCPARLPQALQLVQKATLIRKVDDILEALHSEID